MYDFNQVKHILYYFRSIHVEFFFSKTSESAISKQPVLVLTRCLYRVHNKRFTRVDLVAFSYQQYRYWYPAGGVYLRSKVMIYGLKNKSDFIYIIKIIVYQFIYDRSIQYIILYGSMHGGRIFWSLHYKTWV